MADVLILSAWLGIGIIEEERHDGAVVICGFAGAVGVRAVHERA